MLSAVRILTIATFAVTTSVASITPRDGWKLVPGAEDLISAGNWACVSGVNAAAGSLSISAGTGFNTVYNTTGPVLRVTGDFSIIASLSGAASSLTLVGALNNGDWWNGLSRLDVSYTANAVQAAYWTGATPNPVFSQSFTTTSPLSDPVTLEVSRMGPQIVLYVNGSEAARFNDPGLFASGQVYFGFNIAPGNTLNVSAMAAAMPASASAVGSTASFYDPSLQVVKAGSGLRDYADQSGFLVGAAVNPALIGSAAYARTLGQNANVVVAENAMKFAETEPGPYRYNFCQADQMVRFAQTNGMKVRGHNLVWQQDLPNWLTAGNYTAKDAAAILQDHIQTVVGHFKGKVFAWDVVNEAIAYGAPYGPQPSYWLNTIGSTYIDQAFRWARAADPAVKLFYNDTGGEGLGAKSDAVYNLVSGMLSRGVPLDGVGLQMHVDLNHAPSPADVSANIQRLARLGLEVQITEMDVRISVPATASDLVAQANIYSGILGACLANINCTGFLTWGVSDASSWVPGAYPGFGSALPFDNQYMAKPAASALVTTLAAAASVPRMFYRGVVIHGGVSQTVSPGSLVDIYGSALAPAAATLPADSTRLPSSLGGVQVVVNGAPAPLYYVSAGQVIFQMPYEVAPGTATVTVTVNGVPSSPAAVSVQAAAPGILTWNGNRAVMLNQDFSVNSATNCAAPGSIGVTYVVGSGPVDNPVATGAVAPLSPLSNETFPTTVTVGGSSARVLFAGLAPSTAGLVQINFVVPSVPAGDNPMQVTIGSAQSNQPLVCVGQ